MAAGPVFPGFIRIEYKTDGSSKAKFLAEAAQLGGEIKKPFSVAFDQIGKMVDRVSGKLKDGDFRLDLDVSSLRQASAQADFTMKKVQALRDAAISLATSNRDSSESTRAFVTALQAQAAQAEAAASAARDQVTAYSNLQTAVQGLTRENEALAQSYRDTFLEQAKVANAAYAAQQQFNALSAPGLGSTAKSARDSASVFENQSYAPKADLRSGLQRLVDGDASLDKAAASGTRLEDVLRRVSVKGKEVTAALREAAIAAERAAAEQGKALNGPKPANAAPQSTRFGVDALVAGQASLDRAAISATTLDQVLGRVANKGREVGAALAQAERAAADAARERATAQAQAEAQALKLQEERQAELQRLAQAAERLNAALNPAVGIQQRYNAEIEHARTLLKAGVIDQNLYAQAITRAANDQSAALKVLEAAQDAQQQGAKRGTTEAQNVINSMRSVRVAGIQAGQQLQDMAIQFQSGTRASVVFAQQLPQLGFALSGLEGNTNKALGRLGALGTFLAGPWGAAILIAGVALGPLIDQLFGMGDAADDAKGKSYDFSNGLRALALTANEAAGAFAQLSQEIRGAIAVQGDFLQSKAIAAAQATREFTDLANRENAELQALRKRATSLNPFDRLSAAEMYRMGALAENQPKLRAAITNSRAAETNATIALRQQAALEQADPRLKLQNDYQRKIGELNKRLERSIKNQDPLAAATTPGYISPSDYQAEVTRLTLQKKQAEEALKPDNKGRKGADPAKEAERAARAAQRLGEFGDDAGKKIANIRDSFADIPPEVERINRASRELDDIVSDLMTRKPEGFEQMIAQANALKAALPDAAFQQIMRQIREDSSQQVEVQKLLSQGRYSEADALQKIYQIEDRLGPLTAARKAEILAISQAQEEVNRQLERANEIQSAYLDATRSVRSEVEAILSGTGKLSNLKNVFKQLQGRILAEQLFGDVFRDLDRWVKKETGIKDSVDILKSETERAGTAAGAMADELAKVTARIAGIGTGSAGYVSGPNATTSWAWPAKMSIPDAIRAPGYDKDPNPLTVEGKKAASQKTVNDLTPEEYFRRMTQTLGSKFAKELEPLLGKKLAGNLGGVLGGVFEGQITTGTGFGAILGGLKEIKGLPAGLSKALGGAFGGAQTGAMVSGIGNSLGIKMSNTGAQIGGAIGNMLPIPGGGIFGSIAGGLLGSLFGKKVTSGYAQVRNGTVAGTYGRTGSLQNDAAESANSLVETIASIAKTLGTKLGAYDFDIGKKNDKFVVNTGARGVSTFDTEAEAYAFAVREAVADGAFDGLSAGAKRLLQNSGDLQAQVEKALSFQNVFKSLKAFKDPVGAALDELNTEFQGLIDIFKEAGASASEYASLEELYGIRRADAVKEANQKIMGSLLDFQKSLTVGNDTLSLRDRNAAALAVYNPLADRVKAGDTTAYDEFVSASQDLLAIQRELYGSTSAFFATQDSIKAITDKAVSTQTALADSSAATDSPFAQLAAQQSATTSAIDAQTSALIAALGGRLDSLNDNTIAVYRQLVANGATAADVYYFTQRLGF